MKKDSTQQSIQVKQSEEKVPVEVLAQSIVDISAAMKRIDSSRLSPRALHVLLRDATGVGMTEIRSVLGGIRDLERLYVRPQQAAAKANK